MTAYDTTPIYNLNAVLRETGLKADLMRAWERRYGLPQPQRSDGGHRLYSQYDIETLKWLKAKQAQGLSISKAVQLWKSTIQNGRDPLGVHPETLQPAATQATLNGGSISELRQKWINACTNFDNSASEDVLNLAFSTHPVEVVITEILQKGMNEIGKAWFEGKVSVQQEHYASSLAERRLQILLSLTPPPILPQTVLVGCPPGEIHVLPVMMIELFLRRKGYNVLYLGADIPVDQMVATCLSTRPNLVILSAQTIRTAASLLETYHALQDSGIPLAYGGLIFNRVPAIREVIPAHFLGEDLLTAVAKTGDLLTGNGLDQTPVTDDNHPEDLVNQFQKNRAAIEFFVQQRMLKYDPQMKFIPEANLYFSGDLIAALKLGNPVYLETDLDWVRLLLTGRNIHGIGMKDYLNAYRDGIMAHLGAQGEFIVNWLDSIPT